MTILMAEILGQIFQCKPVLKQNKSFPKCFFFSHQKQRNEKTKSSNYPRRLIPITSCLCRPPLGCFDDVWWGAEESPAHSAADTNKQSEDLPRVFLITAHHYCEFKSFWRDVFPSLGCCDSFSTLVAPSTATWQRCLTLDQRWKNQTRPIQRK